LHFAKVRRRIKVIYGCSDADRELICERALQRFDARISSHQIIEKLFGGESDRGYDP
jgi:hypothetical protein